MSSTWTQSGDGNGRQPRRRRSYPKQRDDAGERAKSRDAEGMHAEDGHEGERDESRNDGECDIGRRLSANR